MAAAGRGCTSCGCERTLAVVCWSEAAACAAGGSSAEHHTILAHNTHPGLSIEKRTRRENHSVSIHVGVCWAELLVLVLLLVLRVP
jgi:hypothetical protein